VAPAEYRQQLTDSRQFDQQSDQLHADLLGNHSECYSHDSMNRFCVWPLTENEKGRTRDDRCAEEQGHVLFEDVGVGQALQQTGWCVDSEREYKRVIQRRSDSVHVIQKLEQRAD